MTQRRRRLEPPAAPPTGKTSTWQLVVKVGLATCCALVAIGALGELSGGKQTVAAADDPLASKSASAHPTPSPTPKHHATSTSRADKPGIGQIAADGPVDFRVARIEPGVERIGDEYLSKRAQGQFVLVYITATNTAATSRRLSASLQRLYDVDGQEYDPDPEAGIYDEASNRLWSTVKPGRTVRGLLIFDIPVGIRPSRLELHARLSSTGAIIQL